MVSLDAVQIQVAAQSGRGEVPRDDPDGDRRALGERYCENCIWVGCSMLRNVTELGLNCVWQSSQTG